MKMSRLESAIRVVLKFNEAFNRHDVAGMMPLRFRLRKAVLRQGIVRKIEAGEDGSRTHRRSLCATGHWF